MSIVGMMFGGYGVSEIYDKPPFVLDDRAIVADSEKLCRFESEFGRV